MSWRRPPLPRSWLQLAKHLYGRLRCGTEASRRVSNTAPLVCCVFWSSLAPFGTLAWRNVDHSAYVICKESKRLLPVEIVRLLTHRRTSPFAMAHKSLFGLWPKIIFHWKVLVPFRGHFSKDNQYSLKNVRNRLIYMPKLSEARIISNWPTGLDWKQRN